MAGFLLLNRMIGDKPHPVAINLAHVVAVHPAVYFDHYGKASFRDGSHVWTTLEDTSTDNTGGWLVIESYDEISKQVNRLIGGSVS